MVDVSEKMVGKTAKELLGFGARAYATSNYDAAVQFLSRATELTVAEEGSHTHDSLGEVYFLYGKSLLELSREEGDPLGDVVPKDVAFEQEAEEEEEGKDAEGKDAEGKDAEGDVGSGDDGSEESDDEEDVEDEEGDEDGNDSEGVAGEKGDGEVSEQDNKTNEEEKKVGSIKITSNGVEFNGEIEKSEAIENLENDDKYKSLDNLEKIGQFGRRGDLTKAGTSGKFSFEIDNTL